MRPELGTATDTIKIKFNTNTNLLWFLKDSNFTPKCKIG